MANKQAGTRARGAFYEEEAVKFLKKKKYKIIERNFYSRQGEIDIVAKQENVLVFIEVKAREKSTGLNPFEAVDEYKKKKIISAAKKYLLQKNMFNTYIRFDVAGITVENGKVDKIEIIKDAFQE